MISKEALTLLFLLCACGAATSIVLGRRKRAEAPEKTRVRWAADDAPYRYSEQKDEPLKPPRPRPGVLSRGLDALAELVERARDFYSNLSERGRQKALIIASATGLCVLAAVSAIVLLHKKTLEATVTFGSWENVVHVARYAPSRRLRRQESRHSLPSLRSRPRPYGRSDQHELAVVWHRL